MNKAEKVLLGLCSYNFKYLAGDPIEISDSASKAVALKLENEGRVSIDRLNVTMLGRTTSLWLVRKIVTN